MNGAAAVRWPCPIGSILGVPIRSGEYTRGAGGPWLSDAGSPARARGCERDLALAVYARSMQMPRVMRRINRDFTNRLMGPVATYVPPMAVVHHVGRKSGRAHRTPVLAFPLDRGILTPLPYGTDTDGVLNLLAAGHAELEVSGSRREVENPRVIGTEAALDLVPGVLGPLVRLLDLPGFVLLDRVAREGD